MDKLIADEMITLVKRAPKFSIYSVNNYAKYRQQNDQQEDLEPQWFEGDGDQQNVQQTTSKRPANDQQVTTKEKGSNKVNKDKKVKKDIIPKINFAEFVSMTQEEYDKLLEAHGQDKLNRIIETLDNYKGANNKKYASDYRAILNWVVKRVEEDSVRQSQPPRQQKQWGSGTSGKPKIEIYKNPENMEVPSDEEWQRSLERARKIKEEKLGNKPA
jgi:hypothetical protein